MKQKLTTNFFIVGCDSLLPAFEMIQYPTFHYFQVADIKVQALTNCTAQQTRQLFYFVENSVLLTYHSQQIQTFIDTYNDAHFMFLRQSNQFLRVLCLPLIKINHRTQMNLR